MGPFAAAMCLALMGIVWPSPGFANDRVLVYSTSGDRFERKLQAELRARGFEVSVEREEPTLDVIAAIWIQPLGGVTVIWVVDRATQELVMRTLTPEQSAEPGLAARKTVELLRASLLELRSLPEPPQPPSDAVNKLVSEVPGAPEDDGGLAFGKGHLFVGCRSGLSDTSVEVWSVSAMGRGTRDTTIDDMGHRELVVRGDYLFGLGSRGGALAADITNPLQPIAGGEITGGPTWPEANQTFGGGGGSYCTDLALQGDVAYLACGQGIRGGTDNFRGLFTIDITNLLAPAFSGRFFLTTEPVPKLGLPRGGTTVVFSSGPAKRNGETTNHTVTLLNTSNATMPRLVDRRTDDFGEPIGFWKICDDVDASGAYVYLSCSGRMHAIDPQTVPLAAQDIPTECIGNKTGRLRNIEIVGCP